MKEAGLRTYVFDSSQHTERICKIGVTIDRLKQQAEFLGELLPLFLTFENILGYNLQYDPDELRFMVEAGVEKIIQPVKIKHNPQVTPLDPYTFIYGPYHQSDSVVLIYLHHIQRIRNYSEQALGLVTHSPRSIGRN